MEEFREPSVSQTQAHAYGISSPNTHGVPLTNESTTERGPDSSPNGTDTSRGSESSSIRTTNTSLSPGETTAHRGRLFLLTASEKDGVQNQSDHLLQYLRTRLDRGERFLTSLAFTLANRRSILDWRLVASAVSAQGLQHALEEGNFHLNRTLKPPGLAFIFPGQGAQWPTMGQQLMMYPVSATVMKEAEECLQSFGAGWSLLG